jgi:hypothetical protein
MELQIDQQTRPIVEQASKSEGQLDELSYLLDDLTTPHPRSILICLG